MFYSTARSVDVAVTVSAVRIVRILIGVTHGSPAGTRSFKKAGARALLRAVVCWLPRRLRSLAELRQSTPRVSPQRSGCSARRAGGDPICSMAL